MKIKVFFGLIFISLICYSSERSSNIDKYFNRLNEAESLRKRAEVTAFLRKIYPDLDSLEKSKVDSVLGKLFVEETDRFWNTWRNNIKTGTFGGEERGEWFGEYIESLKSLVSSLDYPKFIKALLVFKYDYRHHREIFLNYPDTTLKYAFEYLEELSSMREKLKSTYSKLVDRNTAEGFCLDHYEGISSVFMGILEKEKQDNYEIKESEKKNIKNIALKMAEDESWGLREVSVKILSYFPDDPKVLKRLEEMKNNDPFGWGGNETRSKRYPVREAAEKALEKIKEKQNIESDSSSNLDNTKKN